MYLLDSLSELVCRQLPMDFLDPLLSAYSSRIAEAMEPGFFLETVHGLLKADMKLDMAAQLLHLHKNSVIARLKKIKELLNINPVTSPRDALLLESLYVYMTRQREH